MSITIDIHIDPARGDVAGQLDSYMAGLGFVRAKPGYAPTRVLTGDVQTDHDTMVAEQGETDDPNPAHIADGLVAAGIADTPNTTDAPTPTRERGQPSPGKKRRTAAEIAEDDAAAETSKPSTDTTGVVATNPQYVEAANISTTPEDRQDPANPEPTDSPEDAAQDAADEAAETAATKAALTLDDVRNALGEYVTKFGLENCQLDGPRLIARVLGKEHDEKTPCKVSDLGDDQALIKRAIDGVAEMIAKNPFGRTEKAAA